MGIFDRFSTMLRSNLNDLISRAEQRLTALEAVVADLQDDHALVTQLEDRLTRTERRVAGHSGRSRRSDRSSRPAGELKVGKLWTPPPYKA